MNSDEITWGSIEACKKLMDTFNKQTNRGLLTFDQYLTYMSIEKTDSLREQLFEIKDLLKEIIKE